MASPAPDLASSRAERRDFQRVPVKLYGRFMLEDRTEHPCQVIDMSPGNVALRAERLAVTGERVIAYLDHVGRIEGIATRRLQGGFAMTINASDGKRDKLAAQLTWLANKHELDLPEDRRHERLQPRNPISVLKLTDGRQYRCKIADLSLSGAGIEIETKPELGTEVMLGSIRGRIVRHFADGVAIEFANLQRLETLEEEFNT